MSATLQVTRVPELVSNILDQSDDVTARRCVYVNKMWSGIALDLVWRVVSEPFWIFGLLSPFYRLTTIGSPSGYPNYFGHHPLSPGARSIQSIKGFAEKMFDDGKFLDWKLVPRQKDWDRAKVYFRRIKVVKFDSARQQDIYTALFLSFTKWCPPTADLFPNLHTFICHGKPETLHNFGRFFLGPSIRTIDVLILVDDEDNSPIWYSSAILSVCELLASHLKDLVYVQFACLTEGDSTLDRATSEGFSIILSAQQRLQTIAIGHNCVTPQVFDQIGALPELIELNFLTQSGAETLSVDVGFTLSNSRFPTLQMIQLHTDIPDHRLFITSESPAANITCISLHHSLKKLPDSATYSGLGSLLQDVTSTCSQLQELIINWLITNSESKDPMSFLNSLLTSTVAKQIWHLHIHTQLPWLQLSPTNMEEIAASLPSIRALSLNPTPLQSTDPHSLPSLTALLPFAKHCQYLQTLSLCIGLGPWAAPAGFWGFRSLSCLNFGKTAIEQGQVEPLARLLAGQLPLNCLIQSASSGSDWQMVQILFSSFARQNFNHYMEIKGVQENANWRLWNAQQVIGKLRSENAQLQESLKGLTEGSGLGSDPSSEPKNDNVEGWLRLM